MKDYITLGPVPADEECTQVGDPDYREKSIEEGTRYIELIRRTMGAEPPGTRLKMREFPHDLGAYIEVIVEYDVSDPMSIDYAYRCESDGPRSWNDGR